MIGPRERGFWTASLGTDVRPPHPYLVLGARYRVVRAFRDYDGDEHPLGESWTLLACNFAPHDDGASLFVSRDGADEWHIRLQWLPEAQAQILDLPARFLERDPTT